jgi:ankyrin repeat protein
LASLLIERGANLEEVNDEGYTPLMEAAREGHEEMVALLLAHGKLFNYIFHTVNDIVLMFLIKVLNTLIKLS